MADSREQFLQDTDAAIQAEPLTVALSLLNNTPGTLNGRGSTYIFRAVGDIEVTDSVELSTEPGVMGRIGPKFPRSASFRVRVHDNPTTKVDPKTGLFTPETARAQHNLLRNLVGTLMYIDARAAPPERIIWTIENVKAVDDNSAKNAYDVDVSAREILGGEFGEFIDPNELSTESGLVPVEGDGAIGIGSSTCDIATTDVSPSTVPRLTETVRRMILPGYVSSSHDDTYALLPDWIGYFLGGVKDRNSPLLRVQGAYNQLIAFLKTVKPADAQIVSVETATRPTMADRTYACLNLTTHGSRFTLSFEKGETSFDVGVHLDGDAGHSPYIIGSPSSPIFFPDPFDSNLGVILLFIGDAREEEKVVGVNVGQVMLIIRGFFQ